MKVRKRKKRSNPLVALLEADRGIEKERSP